MTQLPFHHPGTVEITKHFGLAMLQVSAELMVNGAPKCVDHDITTLPNHNLIKLWINSTSAFITHWNLAKKVYGVTSRAERVQPGSEFCQVSTRQMIVCTS